MKLTKSVFGHFWPILIFGFMSNSNAQVNESFDDGNFISNPIWEGDTAKFKVISGVLQSQSVLLNDQFYLSTQSKKAVNSQWEFYLKLNFNTSSANYVDIFLSSDSANLLSKNSGYLVRVGSTNDNISLYKKSGNALTPLILGKFGTTNSSNTSCNIKIIHDIKGYFSLWRDSTSTGKNYVAEGLAHDSTFKTSNFFGIVIRQSTTSFHKRHFFDNIYCGNIIKDTIAPWVKSVTVLSPDTLQILFSEPLHSSALWLANFELNEAMGAPKSTRFLNSDSTSIEIVLAKALIFNIFHELKIKNCHDKANNILKDTMFKLRWVSYQKPKLYDIVINECMIDPDPVIGLPNHEYIELYNRSGKFIDLNNCYLADKISGSKLPKIVLEPDSFVILCDTDFEKEFSKFGPTFGLNGFQTLNNSGDELFLRNDEGKLVHRIKYNLNSYEDIFKQNGGWSIEMIDPNVPCGPLNYKASINENGGTPGKSNSIRGINPDWIKPRIISFSLTTDSSIRILFNEPLDSAFSVKPSNFTIINNGIKQVISHFEVLEFYFTMPLSSNKLYTLSFNGIADCNFNLLNDTSILMALPEKVLAGDILLNEVLFNPESGGDDFIELVNNSDKILSLKNLIFFNFDENMMPKDLCILDTSGVFFLPRQILAFTVNPLWTIGKYHNSRPENLYKMSALPALNDQEGYFGIANGNGDVIDQLNYSEDMHLPILTKFEGVSLERVRTDLPSAERSNWTSAAASYGYATPGQVNSHSTLDKIETKNWLSITPPVFSPDQDGIDDLVALTITSDRNDQQATLIIFDVSGKLIKVISNNMPIGNTQTWFWDGSYDGAKKTPIGIYIVYAELFGLNGKRQVVKKTITLGGK